MYFTHSTCFETNNTSYPNMKSSRSYMFLLLDDLGLQDLRVDEDHEVNVELRDSEGGRVWSAGSRGGREGRGGRGGEHVAAFLRRRDSSARPDSARVVDKGDGSYTIVIRPPKPGAYLLAVTLNNTPVKVNVLK